MKKISLSIVTALLAACASKPTTETAEAPKPTYSEKAGALTLQSQKGGTCVREFQKEDWRKVVTLANVCVKMNDWGQVEKMGDYLARVAPLTPWGAYYLALAASARRDLPRARWMLELALKKAPNEGLFHYELGRLDWETGDEAEAIKEIKQAADLSPALTDAHYVTGQLALRRDDFSEARRRFERVLANDPNHVGALMAAAQVEINTKDYAKGEMYLSRAIAQAPRSSKARLALAQVQELHLKKFQEALRTYRELKAMAGEHKLDEGVRVDLDEKIKALEKSVSQVNKSGQATSRSPSGERQVAK